MITDQAAMVIMLAMSLLVTLINTVIVATTRAAVSELKCELIEKLAPKTDIDRLEARLHQLEQSA